VTTRSAAGLRPLDAWAVRKALMGQSAIALLTAKGFGYQRYADIRIQ
jgi:hypothetical protein